MSRKVIGVGETVLDIIFKNSQPQQANPGGSTFNSTISLGRAGVKVFLVSEVGDDEVGGIICSFLKDNNVDSSCVRRYAGMKSKIAMAFLDESNDAHYSFYGGEPDERKDFLTPEINADDVVIFGSFYALNPANRVFMRKFLSYARERGAIIYYDINFRPSHSKDLETIRPFILENIAAADIVRASADDISLAFGMKDPVKAYEEVIGALCPVFICTNGPVKIVMANGGGFKEYPVNQIEPVSTIGAGDSFNAGIAYSLIRENVFKGDLSNAPWDRLVEWGQTFSSACCMSMENYIGRNLLIV